jgi:hypothetical protein
MPKHTAVVIHCERGLRRKLLYRSSQTVRCGAWFRRICSALVSLGAELPPGRRSPVTKTCPSRSIAPQSTSPIQRPLAHCSIPLCKARLNPGYLRWIRRHRVILTASSALNSLGQTLSENNLLIIGASLPDGSCSFYLAGVQTPFTATARKLPACRVRTGSSPTLFSFTRASVAHSARPRDPCSFAREFARRAPLDAAADRWRVSRYEPRHASHGAGGARWSIFFSYSHAPGDAAAAIIIVKSCTLALLVWPDDDRFTCEDDTKMAFQDTVAQGHR